jgi:flagellar biosynthesis/type III secretory pathway protein FliH
MSVERREGRKKGKQEGQKEGRREGEREWGRGDIFKSHQPNSCLAQCACDQGSSAK